jgi:S-adenosylmethionine hydrolase
MIVLFTDFGLEGPYTGQMKAVLHRLSPHTVIIDLFSDAPAHDPMVSSYLLAAYAQGFPDGTIFLSVVDPGVGGIRRAIVVRFGKNWFVGPENGLIEILLRQNSEPVDCWEIMWKPDNCSASFHGRDIFSPIAARLAQGEFPSEGGDNMDYELLDHRSIRRSQWPDDLAQIIYFDRFGNAMTGIRAKTLKKGQGLSVDGKYIRPAETFTDVESGDMFCYENANGLLEIAVNKGVARERLGLKIGGDVSIIQL